MKNIQLLQSLPAILAGGLIVAGAPAAAEVTFKDETFKVMVGFHPGGG